MAAPGASHTRGGRSSSRGSAFHGFDGFAQFGREFAATGSWKKWIRHPGFRDVPVADPSAALLAKLAFDEGVLWAMSGPGRGQVDEAEVKVVAEDLEQSLAFHEERGWLEDPASFHETPPPLDDPELRRTWQGPQRLEEMTFASGYEPPRGDPARERWLRYRANHTAHAWVMRQRPASSRWLVCVHGYGMGNAWLDSAAFQAERLHRRFGLNVLCYVQPLHGPRKPGGFSGSEIFRGPPSNPVHMSAQAIWDLRRILGWIRAQGSTRVGVYGLSLGAHTAALLSTFDEDLDCVIAGIPAADLVSLFRGHYRDDSPDHEPFWQDLTTLQRPVSPLARAPRVPREKLYMFAGLVDRLVPPELARRLWVHWGEPRIAWYPGSHVSFRTDAAVKRLLRDALDESGLAPRERD